MITFACCLLVRTGRVRIGVRIRFSVWLVSGYAHVFVLSVVIVTLPFVCTDLILEHCTFCVESHTKKASGSSLSSEFIGTVESINNVVRCAGVYVVAEKKTSLGKDWHAMCLKCKKCNKILSPGQHSEVSYSSL